MCVFVIHPPGRAFLFNKVVNLVYSEVQDRVMLTGRHMVRDVSCKNCSTKLGWVYEFATEENQRYEILRIEIPLIQIHGPCFYLLFLASVVEG